MNDFFGLKLEDFIPTYADFDPEYNKKGDDGIFNVYDDNSEGVYYRKKEFYKLPLEETKPSGPGIPLMAQHNVSRFLSPRTLNDELLVFHGLGSGKCVHPDTTIYVNSKQQKISELWKKDKSLEITEDGGEWITPIDLYTKCIDKNKKIVKRAINKVYRQHVTESLYTIKLSSGIKLTCTGKHKLYTSDNKWVESRLLQPEEFVHREYYDKIIVDRIVSIDLSHYCGYVYDLEVDLYHNYIANDIITHNTCSAVTIAELARSVNPSLKRTLVLVKGGQIRRNFINELAMKCTKGTYIPDNYDSLTRGEKVIRMNRLVNKYYDIHTFETFAKNVIFKSSDAYLKREYSDRTILIDEAHNIREQDRKPGEFDIYKCMHRFLHLVTNCKKALFTATPMKDKPSEFASVMNLILPLDQQLPTGKDFMNEFFDGNKLKNKERLAKAIRGRVSYLRSMESNVLKKFMGMTYGDMKQIRIHPTTMSEFQTEVYNRAFRVDMGEKNINELKNIEEDDDGKTQGLYDKSRQASLFVFPDGSYGNEGFTKYVRQNGSSYSFIPELKNLLTNNGKATPLDVVANIRKYSTIYADTIHHILKHPDENVFVYNKYVQGSGSICFGLLLELAGIARSRGYKEDNENDIRKPRYAIITGETSSDAEVDRIIDGLYNDPANKNGKYLQVIIGSQVIGEGKSLKNVRQVHVQTPHWNNSETEQGIGRGIRAFSHDDLSPDQRYAKIFRHASIPNGGITSINYMMYKISEDKDVSIKMVERVCKEVSFDCQLNRKRNLLATDVDGTRECEYQTCEYKCKYSTNIEDEIDDTYNIYYADERIQAIETIVKQLFRRRFCYDLTEFVSYFSDTHPLVIIRALKRIIDRSIPLYNKFGFRCYLREDKNMYFIVDEITAPSSFSLSTYTSNPNVKRYIDFDNMLKILQLRYTRDKIDIINKFNALKEGDKVEIMKIIESLPLIQRELFIEGAVIGERIKKPEGAQLRKIILEYYKSYIKQLNGKIVSTLLEEEGTFRCLNDGENTWKSCSGSIEDEIEEASKEKKAQLQNNPYGYYGIISKNKKLKIMKVEEEKEDKRKQLRGSVCVEIVPKQKIVDIVNEINDYNNNNNIQIPSTFGETDRTKMIDSISKNSNYTKSYLSKLSIERIRNMYYWNAKADKKEICNSLQRWFEDNNYISYEK
jgi:hypothetical protein